MFFNIGARTDSWVVNVSGNAMDVIFIYVRTLKPGQSDVLLAVLIKDIYSEQTCMSLWETFFAYKNIKTNLWQPLK